MPRASLEQRLNQAWPNERWRDVGVLVAVSGGPDSVALLRAVCRTAQPGQGRLRAAHFNHRWRGAQADEDQRFVVALCASLGLPCEVGAAESAQPGLAPDGLEAAAREARYRFLLETAQRTGARYVVTGHTADDQAETILHHILRGTGLLGLAGMRRARALSPMVTLARPLLDVRRSEVIEYLAELEQPYRDDATNADRSLTRNRIRHELLPLLEREYAPAVAESLVRSGALAADAQEVLESLAEGLLDEALVEHSPERLVLACAALRGAHRHLVRELFVVAWRRQGWPRQAMGLDQWNQLAELATGDGVSSPTIMLPGAIQAERCGERLSLAPPAQTRPAVRSTHA